MKDAMLNTDDKNQDLAAAATASLRLTAGENPDAVAMALQKSKELGIPYIWAREMDNADLQPDVTAEGLNPRLQRVLAENVDRAPIYRGHLPALDRAANVLDDIEMSPLERYEELSRERGPEGLQMLNARDWAKLGYRLMPSGELVKYGQTVPPPVRLGDIVSGDEERALIDRTLEALKKATGFDLSDWESFLVMSQAGKKEVLGGFIAQVERENALLRQLNADYPEGWIDKSDQGVRELIASVEKRFNVDLSDISIDRLRKGGLMEVDYLEAANLFGVRDIFKLATRMSPEELASVNADSPIEDQLAKLKHLSEQSIALRGFDLAGKVATGVVHMIPYMAEIALTSGIATAGKVGVGTAVKSALRQGGFTGVRAGAKALFTKQGAKAIGQAVKAIATGEAKRLPFYIPRNVAQAYSELNSGPVYFFEEGGVKTVVPEAEVGEMFTLIARKMLETYAGNAAEWTGEFVPGVDLTKLVPERMYPKGLQAKVVQRFLSDISGDATKRAALKRALADSVPLQGVLGEMVEEWVDNAFSRASTLAGQITATEFLDMGRDSVFGDAEENMAILLTSIIGSTGGKLIRLIPAAKHYHDLTRFVDGHRKLVSAVQDLAGELPGGVGEAETYVNLARKGDAYMLIDPDDAEAFYQTNRTFAEAVGVTEKAISEARDEGRLLLVYQTRVAAEQAKSPDGEAAGEALLSITQQAGVTVDEARTADIAGEAIDAYKQQQERLRGFRLKIQTAIRAAAKEAGISVRAQMAFAAMAAFQVSYLDRHSTEDGLIDKALDALIVDFLKNPGKYEPAEGLAQKVYHGTPHTWEPEPGFPHGRPRLDKVGTGEGVQAFGWGWYSAEAKAVAESYRIANTGDPGDQSNVNYVLRGLDQEMPGIFDRYLRVPFRGIPLTLRLLEAYGTRGDVVDAFMEEYPEYAPSVRPRPVRAKSDWVNPFEGLEQRQVVRKWVDMVADFLEKNPLLARRPSLYTLDIPDKYIPLLLIWDEALTDQPEGIPEATLREIYAFVYDGDYSPGDVDGATLYKDLSAKLGGDRPASEYLLSKGIPGLKYRDGFSREGTENPTYNYVIWDQKVLDEVALLERNGEAMRALYQGEGQYRGRFSPAAELDKEYLEAVKAGDMETAQKMVNDAAEKAGVPIIDDSESAAFRVRRGPPPKKTIKAYKLVRTMPSRKGEIFPLFVGASTSIPMGVWLDAIPGESAPPTKTGVPQVKSRLGGLSFRPGWHAGDAPLAAHIGTPSGGEGPYKFVRKPTEVWVEVEMAADIDYQDEANANGMDANGVIRDGLADIKHMPVDGFYRYKTNPNMLGKWIISGSMKVNRVMTETEVNAELNKQGLLPMPWKGGSLDLSNTGLSTETVLPGNTGKVLDPVTYDDKGNVIPLSRRFDTSKADPRYQGEGQYRGRFSPAADFNQSFNALITLFKGADASTLPHEAAHWVKRMMEAMVANGQADETMVNDLATIEAWLDRQEYTSEIGTPEYHRERAEKFARGFEEYIRIGKPPAGGPAGAFATLKRMLISIYRYVTSLGVKLDDEIVSVFDRMISSELVAAREAPMLEAIETLKSTFDSLLGLSQPEAKEFIDLVRKARNQTIDTADAEKAKLLKKKKTEWAKEARAVMKAMKVYNAWAALEAEGGLDYAFIAESPDYGKEIADYFRKLGLTSPMEKSGRDVPLFAEKHGYASVDELLSDLMTAKSPQEFVKDYLLQQERDFNDGYELSDAAMTTQANVELLEKLAEALAVKAGREGAVLKRRALAARVQEKLDETLVKDIVSDSDLVKALRNSGKRLVKALNKQDYNTALELLAGIRFNVEMIRARSEAKRLINRTENLVKRARSAKKGAIFGDHHQAIQELAYYFGFSKSKVTWRENYRRRVGSNDFEGETFGDPFGWPAFLLTQQVESYRDLTYADFTALREFAQFLNGEGRNLVKARKGTFANRVATRVEHALEVLSKQKAKYHDRKTETPLAVKASRTVANWGKNLATFLGKADGWTHVGGDRVRGPNIQLRDILVSAYGRMIYLENAAKTPCREALLALVKSTKGMDLLQGLPKFGGNGALHGYSKWTPEMVVAACLNMGTASGRQRLMEGYQWSEADLGKIAAKLTAADWRHIQRIWDTLSGELWRAVADTFLEENHYHLNQVDPLEFEVQTADGQVVVMPGGYYPIRYADRSKGKDIALGFQPRKLHAEVSSIKRRAETIKHPDPVKLELGVLLSHIHESAHYAATRMANREVLGVVMDPEYRNAFGTTQSFEAYDEMMSILKNAANPAPSTEGITRGFEGWARTVLTATALMMNLRSALMQFSSVTIGMQELGSYYVDALAEFARGPLEMRASVLRMSALMRHRADYFDIDLKEAADRFDTSLAAKAKKGFAKVGYAAMRGADTLVATIAWKAKYEQAMAELIRTMDPGRASIEAVARADDFVARTQGAARTIDLIPIQLDQFGRMMSTFITSANAQYNTLLETIGATRAGVLSPGEAFQALAGNLVAPALLGAAIAWVVAGGLLGDDDDDLDRANRYFIQELISYPFAGIPVVRDLVDLASTMIASKITGDKVNVFGYNALDAGAVSAASDVFTTLAKGTDALSERDWSRAAWLWADAIGRATHTPAIHIYERSKRLFEQNGGDLPEVLKDLDKAVKPKEKK
jgi:hypothetical protein